MADREISQLVLQVDASVAVAQRNIAQLARQVRQSSGDMNTALASTEIAHQRLGGAFNQTRIAQMELSHVVTASVDAYAAGFSPMRIMTLEMGRLAEAATFLGGGGAGVLGKLATFMSGPWGIAVLLATSVLGQLFAKMGQGGDSVASLVEKMREQAKQAANSKRADEEWANSIDGLIDRNDKLTESLKNRLKAEGDVDLQTYQAAKRDQAKAAAEVSAAQIRVDNLKAQLTASAPRGQGAAYEASVTVFENLKAQLRAAEGDLAQAQQAVASTQASVVQSSVTLGEEEGKALSTLSAAADLWAKRYVSALQGIENANKGALAPASTQLNDAFEVLKKALGDAASAGASTAFYKARTAAKDLGAELSRTGDVSKFVSGMKAVAAALETAAAAARDAKKGTGELGRQIGFADATAIAKGAGLTVTSGYRSVARQAELYNDPSVNKPGNPVARPGASAHNGVNGKWALDIAFAPGLTADRLKKLYGDQGVALSAVYKESGHFHIEGSRSQAARAESDAARLADRQSSANGDFQARSDQLDQQILAAQQQLFGNYQARAGVLEQQVDAERKQLDQAIDNKAEEEKRAGLDAGTVDAQAKILHAKVAELASAKKAAIALKDYVQFLDGLQASYDQQKQFQAGDLRFADEMATTQAEHRKLQLDILDIVYEQKKYDLQILLAKQQLAGALQDAANTQAQLDRLPTEKAQDQARVHQGTLDPLEAWARSVPKTAAEINEALQSIEAQGIDNLSGAIADVLSGTKSLKSAFKDLAHSVIGDIIQMTVKMLIFRAISGLLGGGGGGAGGLPSTGSFNYVTGDLSSFFTPRANGGPVSPGTTYLVGERGPELFTTSVAGTIIPRTPRLSLPSAANSNGGPVEIVVHVATDENFHANVQQIAGQIVVVAAPEIIKQAAKQTTRSLTRPRLMGGRG